jgi:hypothetical protein
MIATVNLFLASAVPATLQDFPVCGAEFHPVDQRRTIDRIRCPSGREWQATGNRSGPGHYGFRAWTIGDILSVKDAY